MKTSMTLFGAVLMSMLGISLLYGSFALGEVARDHWWFPPTVILMWGAWATSFVATCRLFGIWYDRIRKGGRS